MSGGVVVYLPDLSGGGAERLHVQLAPLLRDAGLRPRFLLDRAGGALMGDVPADVPIDILGVSRQLAALPRLVRYLRRERPAVLIVNMEHMNVIAVLARRLAGVATRVIVTQHNALSAQVQRRSWQWRVLPALYRAVLPLADGIVAVSAGVADDLARLTGIARERITVIHNGVVADDFDARAAAPADHPWLGGAQPVVIGMGRFVAQKDFATLIRAFATLPAAREARLILLGEGPQRGELEALVQSLGLGGRVAMPGFVANPLPWIRRSRLFVLSSRFEGFGNVIAEALACGTPVVSTDCPHGPSEILDGGLHGRLVPVGDPAALGIAIAAALDERPDGEALRRRGHHFSVARCADRYRALIDRLGAGRPAARTSPPRPELEPR